MSGLGGLVGPATLVEGMQFDRGYTSAYMVTNPDRIAVPEEPFVLITDRKISAISDNAPSIAAMVLTTQAVITEIPENNGNGMRGGMSPDMM